MPLNDTRVGVWIGIKIFPATDQSRVHAVFTCDFLATIKIK